MNRLNYKTMTIENSVWERVMLFKIKAKVKNLSEVISLAMNKLENEFNKPKTNN